MKNILNIYTERDGQRDREKQLKNQDYMSRNVATSYIYTEVNISWYIPMKMYKLTEKEK